MVLVFFVGGIWWYVRHAAAGPAAGGAAFAPPERFFSELPPALAPLGSVANDLAEGAQSVVDSIVNAVTPEPWQLPAAGEPYRAAIEAAEARYAIPPMMLARLLYQESRFREDIISGRTVSPAGALGIAQFMPATAAELGVDPLNVAQSIEGAARYLAQLYRSTGDWKLALAAYNWGIGNVQRKGIGAAPAETRAYVAGILGDVGLA